jgi:hypothetical protein
MSDYEARLFQYLKMHVQERPADAQLARQLADVRPALAQRRENAEPMRVRQSAENL